MSTSKTPNYQLHSWLPADEFHLSEINENFTGVDTELAVLDALLKAETAARTQQVAAKVEVVTGAYLGDNTSGRVIDLGRKPMAVLIEHASGVRGLNDPYGTLLVEGGNEYFAKLTEDGFEILRPNYLNSSGSYHVYIAFFLG